MSNSLKYVIGDQNIEKLAMDSRQEKMDKRENQKKEHRDFIEEVGKNKDLEEKIRGIIDEYLSSSTQSLAPELTDAKINFDSLNRTSPIKNIPAAVAVKHRAADSCDSDELIDKKYYELIARVTATHDEPPIITFDDIKHSIPYLPNFPAKFGVHIGQRKLFLSEIQFITECGDDVDYVIYAGAAPSHKGFLMWNLFPKKKFILIDPNKFELYIYDQPHQAIGAAKYSQYIRYLRSSYSAGEKNGFNESELDAARIARTALSSTTKLVPEGRTALSSTTKLVPKGRTSRSADDTPVHSAGINLAVRDSDVPLDEWLDVIRDSPQHIFLAEEYFTVDIAKVLSKLDCIFISDIRTRVHTEKPADTDILWNSAQQLNWIKILEPRACFLKFRTPYFERLLGRTAPMSMDDFEDFQRADLIMAKEKHGIDFIGNFNNNIFDYFKGTVYIQAWPGKSSSESRLLIRAEDINNYVRYDQVEYENKFFYYNCVARTLVHHRNVYASEKEGFDHCNDCALEAHIWQRYMEKYVAPANRDIRVFLNALHLSISRNLFMHGHGYFFRHNINYLRKKLNFRCIDMSRVHFAPVGINRRSERWVNDVKITIKDFYSILTENMSDADAEYVTRCVKHERSSRNNQPIYYMRDLDAKWDFDVIARPVAFFRTAAAIPPLSAFLVLMRALIDCDYKNNLRYVILGEDHFIGMYAQYLPIYFPDLCFLQFGVPRSETNNESHEYTTAPIKPRLYLYSSKLSDAFDSLRLIGDQSLLFIHTECAAARTKKERTAYWKDCVAAIDKIRPKYYIIDTYGDASAAGEIVFGPYAFALSEMNFLVNAAAVPTGAVLSSTSAERADYKSKNFYFKQVTRSFAMKQHAYGDEEWGFDFCNDCANTAAILENYKKYSGDRSSMMQLVRTLIPSTASSCHGYLFNNDDAEWIKQAQHLKFYHFAPRVDAHTDIISHNRGKGHKHDVSAKTPLAQIMRDSQSENYP